MNPHDRQQRPSNPTYKIYKQETLSPHKCVHMTGTKHHAKLHDLRDLSVQQSQVCTWKVHHENLDLTSSLMNPLSSHCSHRATSWHIMTNPHLDHQVTPPQWFSVEWGFLPKATGPGIPLQHSTFIWALPSYWIPLLAPALHVSARCGVAEGKIWWDKCTLQTEATKRRVDRQTEET